MNLSAIKNFYAYDDGDTITPRMGVNIDTGYGLTQFFNPSTSAVTNTDFTKHPAILYPQAYSSKEGVIIVPETTGQQWYYNNPDSDDAAILDSGAVKAKYASMFELTTITVNSKTFPALKIKGNLATAADHTDKYIYYKSTYGGKSFTCQQLITIQETVGNKYEILLSYDGENGAGDDVLSNNNDWILVTANLQQSGINVSGATYKFQHLVDGVWIDVVNITNTYEITSNTLKTYNAGVEGVDSFRAVATYNGETYYNVFQLTDIHDVYYIDPVCNLPGGAVKKSETITLAPAVIDRSSGIDVTTSMGWSFNYTTYQQDGTVISTTTGPNYSFTGASLVSYKKIGVKIEATR